MIPFSLPVGWFDGSQTTQKLLFKSNCSGAFLFSLSTLSFRFNFTCQNLAHSLLKMEKLRLKMNSMQQMMTCKHTQKSEIPWKKNTIHTSHKHVTIFISLLEVFFLFSSKNSFGSKFSLCSQFWWLDGFFLHCFLYVYAVKIRGSWVEKSGQNNFHTQMWHKYVKLLVFSREEKTKTEKEKSIAWVLLLLFPALCRVRLWQFMLLLEFFLLMLLVLWQRRRRLIVDVFHTALTECEWVSEWVSVCFCVSVQMTRWYSSRCCFLNLFGHAYIKLCSKHTMNETTFSSFTSHLPSSCFFCLFWAVWRLRSEKRMAKRIHGLKKWQ